MAAFMEKIVGLYHFFGDRAPRQIPIVGPRPRPVDPWRRDGQMIVSKVRATADIVATVDKSIKLLGGLGRAIKSGDRVLVKPNFNSPDPFPASSDLPFLRAVVELLLEAGARVTIGECSGGVWRPTRNVFRKLGVFGLARYLGVELIAFEDRPGDWVRVKIGGDYLHTATMPRSAYEADKLVYLTCMKTHFRGRYSGALKTAMGFIHPGERRAIHLSSLEQKVAEINLCWQPDLIMMDGRKAFVTGGPNAGQVVEPNLVLASGDLVAIDVEAVNILLSYRAKNKLPPDPWQLPQIATALKHGLGAGPGGYVVVE